MADKLKHNSPDETKYHSSNDIPGTMLPRAAKDGQSMAFDPNRPQTVIVDPGEVGGGFSVDMAKFSRIKVDFNKAANRKEAVEDPSTFFKEAHKLASEATAKAQKPKEKIIVSDTSSYKPIQPIKALQPNTKQPSETDPSVLSEEVENLIAEEKSRAKEAEEYKSQIAAQISAPDSFQPGYVPGPDPGLLEALDRQAMALNQVINVVNTLASNFTAPESSLPKEAEAAVQSHPEPLEYEEEKPVRVPTNIPFIDGDKPGRPKYETYFEMSRMGTMAARYHAVVEGKDCLALIYDTRFEDGFQYLPPNLGEERISVTVPELSKNSYTCSSLGLNWSLGCMDVVILIKHGDSE